MLERQCTMTDRRSTDIPVASTPGTGGRVAPRTRVLSIIQLILGAHHRQFGRAVGEVDTIELTPPCRVISQLHSTVNGRAARTRLFGAQLLETKIKYTHTPSA